jgi:hypothetical protein
MKKQTGRLKHTAFYTGRYCSYNTTQLCCLNCLHILKCHIQNVHFKMQCNFIMQYSCVQHNIVLIEWSTILRAFPYNRKNLLAKWCPTRISCSVESPCLMKTQSCNDVTQWTIFQVVFKHLPCTHIINNIKSVTSNVH